MIRNLIILGLFFIVSCTSKVEDKQIIVFDKEEYAIPSNMSQEKAYALIEAAIERVITEEEQLAIFSQMHEPILEDTSEAKILLDDFRLEFTYTNSNVVKDYYIRNSANTGWLYVGRRSGTSQSIGIDDVDWGHCGSGLGSGLDGNFTKGAVAHVSGATGNATIEYESPYCHQWVPYTTSHSAVLYGRFLTPTAWFCDPDIPEVFWGTSCPSPY